MHCSRDVSGLKLAIIDDVLTTGASMSAAADALTRRGAKVVDGWALAYAEPHQPRENT
jgi:predicted amidophosphoribosyltransferase